MSVPLSSAVLALAGSERPYPQRSHAAAGVQQAIAAAAQTLGISAADLQGALQDGRSLQDLARTHGVPLDTLTTAMSRALASLDPPVSPRRAQVVIEQVLAPRTRPGVPLQRASAAHVDVAL